jgi:plastocyanin
MKRLSLSLGLLALAAVLAACSGATAAPPAGSPAAPSAGAGDALTVVAKDLKFSPTALTVEADAAFDLVLDNQEGAPHNIAIKDAAGAEVFKGEIVTNAKVTNAVPALAAGSYAFWCEIHPDMQGTITAN